MPIRFHLDEHISAHVAAGLRRRNIDVTTAASVGLIGFSDVAHLEFSASTGRVLVTQDDDFLRLHALGIAHAGIAYCPPQSMSLGEMLRRVILIHDLLSPEEMASRVEFLRRLRGSSAPGRAESMWRSYWTARDGCGPWSRCS